MTHDRPTYADDRQHGILDTRLLNGTSVFAFGAGRQFETLLTLSASGINQFDVADFDIVEESNFGQTEYTEVDCRRLKVDAVGDQMAARNSNSVTRKWACKGQDVPRLAQRLTKRSAALIGVDDGASMFELADIAQKAGTDTFVCGTTGDCSQHFVAFIREGGPSLQDLLPVAWKGVQAGYRPPPFFASCKAFSQNLNVRTVLAVLGVLHYRGGSNLRIADVGEELMTKPLIIGSNGVHGDLLTPARFLGLDEIRGL